MSVLIKGMKMPENCAECMDSDLRTTIRCTEWTEISAGRRENERAWSCPLVDLGKHGRLIDADEVVGGLAKAIPYFIDDAVTTAYVEGLQRAKIEIDDEPTVIEAEDE